MSKLQIITHGESKGTGGVCQLHMTDGKEKTFSVFAHFSGLKKLCFVYFVPQPFKCHQSLTFTATRYLPSYTPQVGPLDPVTFKEATLFHLYMGLSDPRVA